MSLGELVGMTCTVLSGTSVEALLGALTFLGQISHAQISRMGYDLGNAFKHGSMKALLPPQMCLGKIALSVACKRPTFPDLWIHS